MSLLQDKLKSLGKILGERGLRKGSCVLICSASFEERCLSIPLAIPSELVSLAAIFRNFPSETFHKHTLNQLTDRFKERNEIINISSFDPIKTASKMEEWIKRISILGKPVLVDTTAFTHEGLLILLHSLAALEGHVQVFLLYAHAQDYSVGSASEDKWLSKGVASVRSVVGFSGFFSPSKKLHLVILSGFEHERALELIRRTEPSIVSLGIPHPDLSDSTAHDTTTIDRVRIIQTLVREAMVFYFDPRNPFSTRDVLLAHCRKYPTFNTTIAALNTKVSTVGVAMAALENGDIQVCYAPALLYNYFAYSLPGDSFTLIDDWINRDRINPNVGIIEIDTNF